MGLQDCNLINHARFEDCNPCSVRHVKVKHVVSFFGRSDNVLLQYCKFTKTWLLATAPEQRRHTSTVKEKDTIRCGWTLVGDYD